MPHTDSLTASFPQVLPDVLLDTPTRDSLLAEAAALGDRYSRVSAHPGDIVADAEEMLGAADDLPDLLERGYAVSAGLFKRIQLLRDEIAPILAEQERVGQMSEAQTEAADKARVELLEIRRRLARIGKAANLPASLFSLETKQTTRLNVVMMKMEEVLENVHAIRARLPDGPRVDELVVRARELIDTQKDARAAARLMRTETSAQVKTRQRLERLLLDAMIYLSAQGLAAYDGDHTREARYRLDHIYGKKPSTVEDPGAGGPEGIPTAAGPSGDEA